MEWIICFIANWSLVTLLGGWRWKKLKVNIWCGILSIMIQLATDTVRINLNLYKVTNPVIPIWGSSLFFIVGPVFGEGILFAMFHPSKTWAIVLHVLWYTTVFTVAEILVLNTGALIYTDWNLLASILINLTTMATLSWFSMVILKKGGRRT